VSNVIAEFIRLYGPAFGPALFLASFLMAWFYHGLLREVAVRQNRIGMLLMDKKIATFHELQEYGLIQDVGVERNILERML
jgi:hypothetical protein